MWGFPGGSDNKDSACNGGDPGSILGSGRSPGEKHGNPLFTTNVLHMCGYLDLGSLSLKTFFCRTSSVFFSLLPLKLQ